MKEFIVNHQTEILSSFITLVIILVLKFISAKTIRKIGKISELHQARTRLVVKYASFGLTILGAVALIFIWGVNVKELALVFSSVFAILGVALFATWSILSNITAGIILFFYFPFKIGDRIRIQDKDFLEEAIIEDIKAFHVHLVTDEGELITYPNNLMLQKGVSVIRRTSN